MSKPLTIEELIIKGIIKHLASKDFVIAKDFVTAKTSQYKAKQ